MTDTALAPTPYRGERLQVRVSTEEMEALKREAQRRRTTVAELVRCALGEYLRADAQTGQSRSAAG